MSFSELDFEIADAWKLLCWAVYRTWTGEIGIQLDRRREVFKITQFELKDSYDCGLER